MRRQNYGFLASVLALVVAGTIGCGGGPTLKTEYVEGVVTLDGTPVAGATVTFTPVNPDQGVSAGGKTDENGVYKLTAVGTGEEVAAIDGGTVPGEYYVAVQKQVVETPISQEEAEEQGIEYVAPEPGSQEVQYLVPKKYKIPAKSGLTATVKEGKNDIPLALTSD
jgi:hypothetical protein